MAASDLTQIGHNSEAPRQKDLDKCVHCGLCTASCPTYVETSNEADSPRGRIYLMRGLAEGRIAPSDPADRGNQFGERHRVFRADVDRSSEIRFDQTRHRVGTVASRTAANFD